MIDHFGIQCRYMDASKAFYDTVLAAVGARRILDFDEAIGYGVDTPNFWISGATSDGPGLEAHIAFAAPSRAAVREFFAAAVGAGAEVLHEPRLWPEYHATYYGAFVRDPEGNNVEAVCHAPEES